MKGVFEKKDNFGLTGAKVKGFKGYPPMFHSHGEILYVIKGSINTVVDGTEHTLNQGEISILFPYLNHSYDNAPDAEAILILFDPTIISFDTTMLTKKPKTHYTNGEVFYPLLERTVTLIKAGKIKTALGYINAIIGELLELIPLEETDGISEDTPVKILEYCTCHFSEDISIKSISEALYVSQSYISKIFSKKFKYGFREYINTLRINKAKLLLKNSDKKIVDIMLECGFKNQSSFNRVFKGAVGLSPIEYRKMYISNIQA